MSSGNPTLGSKFNIIIGELEDPPRKEARLEKRTQVALIRIRALRDKVKESFGDAVLNREVSDETTRTYSLFEDFAYNDDRDLTTAAVEVFQLLSDKSGS